MDKSNTKSEVKTQTGPKDVFLHLLSIITLYFSAINFGVLIYQFINIYFPDPLTDLTYFDPEIYKGPLRWAVASLIIVFPVYIWSNWYLNKQYRQTPQKLELKTRKWLLNFTLFLAALVIIGDLVALVFRYLDGELTARFSLKVLTILLIASNIFTYYIFQLKQPRPQPLYVNWLSKGIIAIIAISIFTGFFIAGSPQAQRLKRIDQRRVTDLQDIQYQIINFWQRKNRLPLNQEELIDNISGYTPPVDPITSQPYEYKIASDLKFELCATFSTESQILPTNSKTEITRPDMLPSDNWMHSAGQTCFNREIDPELYQLNDSNPAIKYQPAIAR